MNLRKLFLFISFFAFLSACNKNNKHPIPYYSFDQTINLTLPSYSPLQGVGGWAYISGIGSKGVVVYRQSVSVFIAFDRHSPDNDGKCDKPLEVDEENFLLLNDLCSGAQFSLYDGSSVKGDSKWGLRSYITEYNGGDLLRIYNP